VEEKSLTERKDEREKFLRELINKNSTMEHHAISTDVGLEAAAKIIAFAKELNVDWALAGGLAMHFYGFTRATKDVDFVAQSLLNLKPVNNLSFGGVTYQVDVGDKTIGVDWIVRDDLFREFYDNALRDAIEIENGMRYITPEWLVILKYIAGRSKDQIDLLWLLQQPNLVDREIVLDQMTEVLGEKGAALPIRELERLFAQADLSKLNDES
jgi:hypothetical protein